jgi:CheY-like chemotaxis protein
VIERNAIAQARLIEDMLDVSRIITGKLRLNPRLVDLSTVVRAAIDVVRPTAEARGVLLDIRIDPDIDRLSGDPDRLEQVIWNLLINAIKFTPAEGRVTVRVESLGAEVRLTVADTGEGIDPGFLPYIFERFRQADGSTTRTHGGLGLGLAIVRHLVELHGGQVVAESAGRGKGARFIVTLPLPSRAGRTRAVEANGACGQGGNEHTRLADVQVLIVDDEPDARELIGIVLGERGAQVRVAGSTAEALEVLKHFAPDVLISDIGMPQSDGYDLIRQARLLFVEQARWVPAIALTAYAGIDDARLALGAGFQAHLAKPVEPEELARTVARFAAEHR